MLGEQLEPVLPRLAALQRAGVVSVEKVQIVERAMHKLTRPGLHPDAVETAEQLLTQYAPSWALLGCAATPSAWLMLPTRTAPNPLTTTSSGGIWS